MILMDAKMSALPINLHCMLQYYTDIAVKRAIYLSYKKYKNSMATHTVMLIDGIYIPLVVQALQIQPLQQMMILQ